MTVINRHLELCFFMVPENDSYKLLIHSLQH